MGPTMPKRMASVGSLILLITPVEDSSCIRLVLMGNWSMCSFFWPAFYFYVMQDYKDLSIALFGYVVDSRFQNDLVTYSRRLA